MKVSRLAPGAALLVAYERRWLRPDALAALSVWALLIPRGSLMHSWRGCRR